jgi:hypothetical protein
MKARATNPPMDLDVTRERLVKLGLTHAVAERDEPLISGRLAGESE